MTEATLKSLISHKSSFVEDFLATHFNYHSSYNIMSEVEIEYGLVVDKIIYDNNGKVLAVIECKGGNIGTTEFVRGIGQGLQYLDQKNRNLISDITPETQTFICFPDELFGKISINDLKYPDNLNLLIVNSKNNSFKVVKPTAKRGGNSFKSAINISPYYVRDNRIGEIYIGLLELRRRMILKKDRPVNRQFDRLLSSLRSPNPGNGRNISISLSSFGFINSENELTLLGYEFSQLNFIEFTMRLIEEYLYSYVNTLMTVLLEHQNKEITWTVVKESCKEIWSVPSDREIEFFTESGNRYISSWMNILRDDIQCISFPPKANKKVVEIIYNPLPGLPNIYQLTKSEKIKFTLPSYINRYLEII